MPGVVTQISRFPVKGLSGDVIPEVQLQSGRGIPGDRMFALALSETEFDPFRPQPLPKTKFVVLMRFAKLASLQSAYDPATFTLVLRQAGHVIAAGSLANAAGCRAIEQAIADVLGSELTGLPRITSAEGHRFTDVSVHSPLLMEAVSIINLASVRAFGQQIGCEVDPRRFRANLLIDGLAPWSEFDLLERDFFIGDVLVKGVRRTRRCPATEVNPDTAERDLRLPLELKQLYGHTDLGIYVSVLTDGTLKPGDAIRFTG